MELRSLLVEYKEATERFIKSIDEDGNGAEFLEKREVIINKLKEMSFNKEELKVISEEINLVEIEKKAFKVLNDEKIKIKEEIINLQKKKEAARSYGKAFGNINFLNKQV